MSVAISHISAPAPLPNPPRKGEGAVAVGLTRYPRQTRSSTSPLTGEVGRGCRHTLALWLRLTSPSGGEVESRSVTEFAEANSVGGEGVHWHPLPSLRSTPSHARFPADAPRANLAAAREVKE